ncbi:hypothetical protein AAFF_G00019640 [Aldrovandia affinis]|uniref:Uncharacterized protein n=1 Tax=Aldrovandia affinis TaxID=143900 RepID=A0AAD7WGR3_9TELE|nr:hypothetical protein AAFF_G00019640 [Aldrovandia affinis]
MDNSAKHTEVKSRSSEEARASGPNGQAELIGGLHETAWAAVWTGRRRRRLGFPASVVTPSSWQLPGASPDSIKAPLRLLPETFSR